MCTSLSLAMLQLENNFSPVRGVGDGRFNVGLQMKHIQMPNKRRFPLIFVASCLAAPRVAQFVTGKCFFPNLCTKVQEKRCSVGSWKVVVFHSRRYGFQFDFQIPKNTSCSLFLLVYILKCLSFSTTLNFCFKARQTLGQITI